MGSETFADQVERVRMMVTDDGEVWDHSDNDRAAIQAVMERLDLVEKAMADRQSTTCSWCGLKTERGGRTEEEFGRDVVEHVMSCDKRPEGKLASALLSVLRPLGIELNSYKPGDVDGLVADVDLNWKRVTRGFAETEQENVVLRAALARIELLSKQYVNACDTANEAVEIARTVLHSPVEETPNA